MSLNSVHAALDDLLGGAEPQVVALKGEWGRGKSYFWRKYLMEHGAAVSRSRTYAYVSLFGLDKLSAVKEAIFAQAEPLELSVDAPDAVGMEARAKQHWWNLRKSAHGLTKYTDLLKLIPRAGDLGTLVHTAAFGTVRDYLICIDDLERRAVGLPLRDILGLVATLRDQRSCRVVVIVNTDALREEDKAEFELFREKVFDYEIAFQPTAVECSGIALPGQIFDRVRERCEFLEITNIRVLLRIKRLLALLTPLVADADDEIKAQVLHSSVLLGWCFNTRTGPTPSYEYVKGVNYSRLLELDADSVKAEEKQWNELLWEYGYKATDALDLEICRTLEEGFVSRESFEAVLANRAEAARRGRIEDSFHSAWEIYHNGFGDDAGSLAEAFRTSILAGAQYISAMNASAAIGLLRDLGYATLADELTATWISAHSASNPHELDIANSVWKEEVRDKQFREAAQAAFSTIESDKRSVAEVLTSIVAKNGWSEAEVRVLAAASDDEYYHLFKSLTGPHIRSLVRASLRFGDIGASPAYEKIGKASRSALGRIASESKLNARRVQSMLSS